MPDMDEKSLRRTLDSALAGRPPMGPVVHDALRAGIKLRRRRRIQGAVGGMAAVALVALAIPATIGTLGHTPGPAPEHRPGGLAAAPRFFAAVAVKPLGHDRQATAVNIYRSATGQVAGYIRPPKPYHNFASVSRLGGDRTFVATVITDLSHAACTTHLFRFSIDGRGHPGGLRPLSVPQVSGEVGELTSSADGEKVAFTASLCMPQTVGLINLATGQTTTWIVPRHGQQPVSFGSLSLTGDGSRLGFVVGAAVIPTGLTNAYVLPTNSPSGPLMRHATKVLHVPTGVFDVVLSNNGSQAYLETLSHGGSVILSQYSTTTGQRVRVVGRLSPGGRNLTEYSLIADAAGKHLLAYGDTHRLKAVNLTTGHQASITLAQIPDVDPSSTVAW